MFIKPDGYMTVKELREVLSRLDPDFKVQYNDTGVGECGINYVNVIERKVYDGSNELYHVVIIGEK